MRRYMVEVTDEERYILMSRKRSLSDVDSAIGAVGSSSGGGGGGGGGGYKVADDGSSKSGGGSSAKKNKESAEVRKTTEKRMRSFQSAVKGHGTLWPLYFARHHDFNKSELGKAQMAQLLVNPMFYV